MKTKVYKFLFFLLIFLSFVIFSCDSSNGENSVISISFGMDNAKAAISVDEIRHVISLDGPSGRKTMAISGAGTARAQVAPGTWRIEVEGYYGNDLYSIGAATATVRAGQTTNVTVYMTVVAGQPSGGAALGGSGGGKAPLIPDVTANNWSDIVSNITLFETEASLGNVVDKIIMLDEAGTPGAFVASSTIMPFPTTPFPLVPGGQLTVTLVTPPNQPVSISRGSLAAQMFIWKGDYGITATLNLGHPNYPENSSLTLDGFGSPSGSPFISLGGYGVATTLNMYKNVKLQNNAGSMGGAVYIDTGTFSMYGGDIAGNSATLNGGGIYNSAGTFDMYGGDITNNLAFSGGGIYNLAGTSFNMEGGTIGGDSSLGLNNIASTNGGGVFSDGPVTISRDAKIIGNMAQQGGGVYIASGGSLTMTGGTIGGTGQFDGNYANGSPSSLGGGVLISGSFLMSGNAAIIGNKAEPTGVGDAFGGGVWFGGSGTFQMDASVAPGNPRINGNTTSAVSLSIASGGGVYLSSGTFTMDAGEINGNTASSTGSAHGGGVYVANPGDFTKTLGVINGHAIGVSTHDPSLNAVLLSGSLVTATGASSDPGHAVYVAGGPAFGRNETATGPLDSAASGGANGWDF